MLIEIPEVLFYDYSIQDRGHPTQFESKVHVKNEHGELTPLNSMDISIISILACSSDNSGSK